VGILGHIPVVSYDCIVTAMFITVCVCFSGWRRRR